MRDPTGQWQGMLRSLRVFFVVLVGLTAGLTAVFADAALTVVVTATVVGLVFGVAVVAVALPRPDDTEPVDPRFR